MTGVVDNCVVEKQEVLVWSTTAHIKTGVSLSRALYPGQQLKHLEGVHFTEQGGERFHGFHSECFTPHGGSSEVLAGCRRNFSSLVNQDHIGRQFNGAEVGFSIYRHHNGFVTNELEGQAVTIIGIDETAGAIGHDPLLGFQIHDIRPCNGLSRYAFDHGS